jgi:hypothetical protein
MEKQILEQKIAMSSVCNIWTCLKPWHAVGVKCWLTIPLIHDFPISHQKMYISVRNTKPLLQIGAHVNIWLLLLNKVFSDIMSTYFYSRLDGAVSK